MLYDDFKPIVDLVFNNWTALQLAVEHGMGTPGGKETAQLMSAYITRHLVENVVDREDLTEELEDIMDEEFETHCRDGSPREIAGCLLHFLEMLKTGRHQELRAQIESMPKCETWLSQPEFKSVPPQSHGNPDDDTTSSSGDEDDDPNGHPPSSLRPRPAAEPMEEDPEPGWTLVRSKRKQ